MSNKEEAEKIRKEVLKDFVKFLKEHKAYIKYRQNIADSYTHDYIVDKNENEWIRAFSYGIYMKILSNGRCPLYYGLCPQLINYAFTWRNTKEGHCFWSNLSTKWTHLFRTKYKQYMIILNESL
jgi:hypothetical protein